MDADHPKTGVLIIPRRSTAKVKSIESPHVRATLAARAKLVDLRRDLENQMRGLLKSLGIILGKAGSTALPRKILDALREAPHLRNGRDEPQAILRHES